ncbi:MAG: branched-chain amino acid ABC transporter permease [Pseudomonadota bacterium]
MTEAPIPVSGKRLADIVRGIARHRVAAALAVLVILPWVAPYEALAINIMIFGLYAVGFNLIFGYTGMLSFGHAAFLGVGAYGCGVAISVFGINWLLAIAIGVVLAGAVAMVVGALAIRTRGIYFAMVTLALAQCVYYILYQWSDLTGGEDGLRGVSVQIVNLGGVELNMLNPLTKYYVMLVFVALALWIFSRILESPFGAVLEAIRENENRARACGYDTARTKWLAFVLSGMFCGLAGALYAIHLSIVPIEAAHYLTSGEAVMMALLGGMGTFFGPFIGAGMFLLLQDVLSAEVEYWQFFTGAIFVIFVLFFPRGIWGSILYWIGK